jgi:uncharacterized protein YegP (UPF0339 family)
VWRDDEEGADMTIRIKYFTDDDGKDRVRISGNNGEPMFTSEAYEDKRSAANAIEVLENAFGTGDYYVDFEDNEPHGDVTIDEEGEEHGE